MSLEDTFGYLKASTQKDKDKDPRNKVDSLLSFTPPARRSCIPVDYGFDTRRLYCNVVSFVATIENSLQILAKINHPNSAGVLGGGDWHLPSWIAN